MKFESDDEDDSKFSIFQSLTPWFDSWVVNYIGSTLCFSSRTCSPKERTKRRWWSPSKGCQNWKWILVKVTPILFLRRFIINDENAEATLIHSSENIMLWRNVWSPPGCQPREQFAKTLVFSFLIIFYCASHIICTYISPKILIFLFNINLHFDSNVITPEHSVGYVRPACVIMLFFLVGSLQWMRIEICVAISF